MNPNEDPRKSTEVKTYKEMPFTFKQLLSEGYHDCSATCFIKNVYSLSSVEGYLPRSNMSYVYDPVDRLLYVMGGYITDEQSDMIEKSGEIHKQMIIHVMNVDTHNWYTIPSKEYHITYDLCDPLKHRRHLFKNAFVQRYGQKSAFYDRKIFIFGGSTRPKEEKMSELSHVECFNLETRQWSIPTVSGQMPIRTMCHASAYSAHDWYIHGGFLCSLYEGQFSNSLHHYDMRTNTISMVRPVESELIMQDMYMDCHSMVYIGDFLYLFGGRLRNTRGEINRLSNRLYSFNLTSKKWINIQNQGTYPEARRSHTATAYKQYMIVFGGCNVTSLHHFNDCHFFDTSVIQWFKINILGLRARPRRSHGCVLVDDSLIIFGGTAPKFEAKTDRGLLERSFNGSQDNALDDISDTIIIEIFPKLKQRCIHVIIDNNIHFRTKLPKHIVRTVDEFIESMQQESQFVYGLEKS